MNAALPRQSSWWDHSRNTSATYRPLPNALPDALRALAYFRRTQPELAAWVMEGYPNVTADEHYARFGEQYGGKPSKRRTPQP